MSLNISKTYTSPTGTQTWIPVNRHGRSIYSITLVIAGSGIIVDIEATAAPVNSGSTPGANDVVTINGLTGITEGNSPYATTVVDLPVEAFRVNVKTGSPTSVSIRIQQED